MKHPDREPFRNVKATGFEPRAVLGDFRLTQAHMVGQLAVSRDRKWAVTDTGGRNSEALYVWRLDTGELQWWDTTSGQDRFLFHPDGKNLLVSDGGKTLRTRSLATGGGRKKLALTGLDDSVSQLRSSSDGTRVLVGHHNVFDVRTGKRVALIDELEGSYTPSYLSPSGNIAVDMVACYDLRTTASTSGASTSRRSSRAARSRGARLATASCRSRFHTTLGSSTPVRRSVRSSASTSRRLDHHRSCAKSGGAAMSIREPSKRSSMSANRSRV